MRPLGGLQIQFLFVTQCKKGMAMTTYPLVFRSFYELLKRLRLL